jgi:hypothetical protein
MDQTVDVGTCEVPFGIRWYSPGEIMAVTVEAVFNRLLPIGIFY